jgi:catechol 2,3-dioxygenase-like lactoylglutathione lyase family enzyme
VEVIVTDHIVGIDHVQLAMPAGEEAAAGAFYAGVLGLTRVPKPEPLASRGGCWFEGAAAVVHLGVEADFRPARKAHPAFRIRDLDGLVAALADAGHSVRWDTDLPTVRRCHVEDPFGNRIELIQD